MWLKFTRAVSKEAETVGERQKKNVLWSDRMKEENKNEAKHSTLHKAFSEGGFYTLQQHLRSNCSFLFIAVQSRCR